MKKTLLKIFLIQHGRASQIWWRCCSSLLLFLSLSTIVFSQTKITDKTIGGNGEDILIAIQQTSDNGYILGGYSYSSKSGDKSEGNRGGYDYWVVKQNADGTKAWDKTYGGNGDDYLFSVQQTKEGGYILGGWSYSEPSGDKTGVSKGDTDYWVVKLDALGNKLWDKTLGGNRSDQMQFLQVTTDGGYILGGFSSSGLSGDKSQASKGNNDYWIVKLQADGSKEWDKSFGGKGSDELISLQQTPDGGFILGGSSESTSSGDKSQASKGGLDYWLIKLLPDGSKAWDKTLGGNQEDRLRSVQQTQDGGYLVAGYSSSGMSGDKSSASKGSYDYWVVKLSATGTKEWDKTIGGRGYDILNSFAQTQDGEYMLGGSSSSDAGADKSQNSKGENDYWIVKLKADGSKVWDKTIGGNGNDILQSVLQPKNEENYLLSGHSSTGKNGDKSGQDKGGWDYWLIKVDNNGENLDQFITFEHILYKDLTDSPVPLTAQASSGLPVSFTVVSGPATIQNENTLSLTGLGTVTVTASQNGNANYQPASSVTRSFAVEPASVVKRQWDNTIGGNEEDRLSTLQRTQDGGYLLGGTSNSNISDDKSQNTKGGYGFDYWIVKLKADGTKEWDKTIGSTYYEDYLTSAKQTNDGGYILGGYSYGYKGGDKSQNNKGGFDYWVVKLSATGTKEWDKTIGGNDNDELNWVEQALDGGYILGGTSGSKKSGDKSEASKGGADYWIVKLQPNGDKVWDKTIGGSFEDRFVSLQQTTDGGFVLGGYSLSGIGGDKTQARKGSADYWIVKLQANGTKVWDKTIGGNDEDYFTSMQQTSDGGYIVGGYSWSGVGVDKSEPSKGNHDYWIVKLNASGTREWDKTIGGNNRDALSAVLQTRDGGYLLGGSSYSNISGDKTQTPRGNSDLDYWVVKLKADGAKVWDKTLGGANSDYLTSIQQTGDATYIAGGYTNSGISGEKSELSKGFIDYWVVEIKENTPLLTNWNLRFGGSAGDNFTVAIKTADEGYLTGGYSASGNTGDKSQGSQGKNDYWIVKTDKNGEKLWDKRYGGSGDDYLNRVIQTADGGYLLGGTSLSGMGGDKSDASQGSRDFWVIKVDAHGNKQWDKTFGGSGQDELKKVSSLASGEYVLAGYSNSPVSGDKTQPSQGQSDYWLVKISKNGQKIWDKGYGGAQNEILGSFTESHDGGFFLGGSSWSDQSGDKSQASRGGSDFWIIKTDKEGNLLWDKTFGGSGNDDAYSVRAIYEDNFFVAGTSDSGQEGDKSQNSKGGKDYWLIKINNQGNKIWDKSFGGRKDDELRATTFTDRGHYILAGHSFSDADGDKTQPSQGASDYWVVEVDDNGTKLTDQRFGGNGTDELRTVLLTPDGRWLLGGKSNSGVSGDRTQPSQGDADFWLIKADTKPQTMVAVRQLQPEQAQEPILQKEEINVTASPNPFSEKITVRFVLPETQPATLKLYDNQGKEVATMFQGVVPAKQMHQVEWQAKNNPGGIYLLQLQTPAKRSQRKLLLVK